MPVPASSPARGVDGARRYPGWDSSMRFPGGFLDGFPGVSRAYFCMKATQRFSAASPSDDDHQAYDISACFRAFSGALGSWAARCVVITPVSKALGFAGP